MTLPPNPPPSSSYSQAYSSGIPQKGYNKQSLSSGSDSGYGSGDSGRTVATVSYLSSSSLPPPSSPLLSSSPLGVNEKYLTHSSYFLLHANVPV